MKLSWRSSGVNNRSLLWQPIRRRYHVTVFHVPRFLLLANNEVAENIYTELRSTYVYMCCSCSLSPAEETEICRES